MPPTLTAAVRQVRGEPATLLDPGSLRELCRAAGHHWRERRLDPVTTIHLFALQVPRGNTACAHLPRLAGLSFTASAYRQARARLPLAALQALLQRPVRTLAPLGDAIGLWLGHRTRPVDGSGVSMPDTPELQKSFGRPPGRRPG